MSGHPDYKRRNAVNFDPGGIMADVLVVASKVKKYIKDKAGMNTSGSTIDALSKVIARVCDEAIQNAKNDERPSWTAT
jgi:hypothetical protein